MTRRSRAVTTLVFTILLGTSLDAVPAPASARAAGRVSSATWEPWSLPARTRHAMAYDTARHEVVLFGGGGPGGFNFGDTWTWDGATWARATPAMSPLARTSTAMAYDAARDRVVLFGGSVYSRVLGDTWEWDGTNGTRAPPTSSLPARRDQAMAYDARRGRIVLFGGQGDGPFGDTWEWDGTDWTRATPATSPSARWDHAMAYDAERDR